MSKIQFRLAARTDAAGKYNATAPLEGNEDNMFIDADLSNVEQGVFMADQVVDLTDKGCLMVVADGMGGMNAGEVASAIAIKTVMEYFDAEHMAAKSFRDSRSRMNYMEEVVVAADAAIKADSRTDKEHEGMGSTIIMAWLCDDEICLTWCGDSRAYLYRPGRGFWQVSKDHSYVQGLVDDGKITMDEAFDHPYGNIITRSLGDPEKKAKADSVNFDIYEGDIFMLCSDGLSGVLRDHKTYIDGQRIETENLEDIIAANRRSMAQCRDELFAAAERNDWYDNVTAILCEIVRGKPLPADMGIPMQASEQSYAAPAPNPVQANNMRGSRISIRKKSLPLLIVLALVLLGGLAFLSWKLMIRSGDEKNEKELYDQCKTANQYRIFLADHPKSKYAKYAQSALDDLIRDSIKQAQSLNVQGEPIARETSIKPIERVDESGKKKKNENEIERKLKEDAEKRRRDSIEAAKEAIINGINTSPTDPLTRVPNINDAPSSNTPKVKQKSRSSAPKTEEEAFQRTQSSNASLEDCYDYVERYGNKARHIDEVRTSFNRLFWSKLNACNSEKEIEDFKKEIKEAVVTKMRLDESKIAVWEQRADDRLRVIKSQK